jgi:ribosomal protein S18 acetylase RimI-like enzyme
MTYEIRTATRADGAGIAGVHVASWRAGYAHVFPEAVLYADDFESSRLRQWTDWRFNPGQRVSVCVRQEAKGELVTGFAAYGPERERARGFTGRGELYAFYFHPKFWGDGSASALIDHVDERLRAEGFDEAVLWVLDDNPRARRFYEKHGWAATGITADFDMYCEVKVPELEYRKEYS